MKYIVMSSVLLILTIFIFIASFAMMPKDRKKYYGSFTCNILSATLETSEKDGTVKIDITENVTDGYLTLGYKHNNVGISLTSNGNIKKYALIVGEPEKSLKWMFHASDPNNKNLSVKIYEPEFTMNFRNLDFEMYDFRPNTTTQKSEKIFYRFTCKKRTRW